MLDYHIPQEGIIKKTVKINCENENESVALDEQIIKEEIQKVDRMINSGTWFNFEFV